MFIQIREKTIFQGRYINSPGVDCEHIPQNLSCVSLDSSLGKVQHPQKATVGETEKFKKRPDILK